jgi:uncharacterized membrane protein
MSLHNFLWTEYNARANIAMLFFAFAMMTLFNDKIEPVQKRILFIVFMASCMVSHYSTTYVFLFLMAVTFIGMEMLSKKYTFKKVISLTLVVLFFAMIFFWYSQVTETAFNEGVDYVKNTLVNLNKFFVEEMREETMQTVLGKNIMQMHIIYRVHWVLTWLTFALIGIGIITLLIKRKEMSFPELNFKKPEFLKNKFEIGYFMITLACSGLLVAVLALPYVSTRYSGGRIYPLAITILSVFFVIGGIILSKNLSFIKKQKRKNALKQALRKFDQNASQTPARKSVNEESGSQVRAYLIILLILIPYFLCSTGVMYNIFGEPYLITLNSEGEQYDLMYIHDQESCSAKWLRDKGELEDTKIYTDKGGTKMLKSQIGMHGYDIYSLFIEYRKINGYIYLRYYNIVTGKLLDPQNEEHNITEYQDKFVEKNRIYDNGGSEVWR